MRAHIKTYGCTLNQADSDIMQGLLERDGVEMVDNTSDADVVIVNTCTVKGPTEQKILHTLRSLEKKGKRVVVAGCMASANQDLIEIHAPTASVITTQNVEKISKAVEETAKGKRAVCNSSNRADKLMFLGAKESVIAKVPVSEGCLSSCSFCETKFARGPLNSFSEDRIVGAVEMCARMGAKEIQLTSQDMGAYGLDRRTNIAKLMERLSHIEGDFKIRVGMLNPEHLGRYLDGFADAMLSGRFYKFAHLPVQSGSDKVLMDMKRMYTVEQFNEQVAFLRSKIPDITIETDIIVGFPTEGEEDFEQTLDFVKDTRPNVVNMCRFWARPHASATKMKQLPNEVIVRRSAELGRIVRHVQKGINDTFLGRVMEVVATEKEETSINARAVNYKKVILKSASRVSLGDKLKVRIDSSSCNVLYGEPMQAIAVV